MYLDSEIMDPVTQSYTERAQVSNRFPFFPNTAKHLRLESIVLIALQVISGCRNLLTPSD